MRSIITFLTLIFILLLPASASFASTTPVTGNTITPAEVLYSRIASLKVKEIQKLIGRKLTLKERVGLMVLKGKMKKKKADESSMGKSAFTLGLASVGLLIAGLFIPYIILGAIVTAILAIVFGTMAYKKDKNDRKAHAGKLMGWITLSLIAILVIAVVAAFASIFN